MLRRQKSKKLPLKKQRKLLQLFNNLMESGFNLTEMVDFLRRSQLLADEYTDCMQESLLSGLGMAEMLAKLGFSDTVVTQLALADVHGNTRKSLQKIESYLIGVSKVRKKVIEVATYPLILLTFLILIMLGLKNYLLPQLQGGNFATKIINHFPMIFLGSFALLVVMILAIYLYSRRLSRIHLMSYMSCLPVFGVYVRLYLTA